MVVDLKPTTDLPAEQQAIRAKCFHPTGTFIEFKKEEVERSIPESFEETVAKYPDRIAIKTKHHEFTYGRLNQTANRVARAILAQRGEGEEPIALLFKTGPLLIVGILGVLKAGKICVPLDPSYPLTRITHILDDTQATLIITNNKNLSLAEELAHNWLQLINIHGLEASLSPDNLGLSLSPDMVASIVYTSGSTGRAKGVVHNHRNVLHQAMGHANSWHICAEDRRSLLRSGSVAAAMPNIFDALLNGAALYPLNVKEEGVDHLADWLISEQITIYQSSVTLFRQFVETVTGDEKFPKLRLIKLSSEAAYKRDVELYKKHFSADCILAHGLAGSEHGMAVEYFIDKETEITHNTLPVGYAVENSEILLLDDAGREVRFGDVGEIAVRSRYLSPGYWRKPELTQAAFLPDPKGRDKRIYLTGDLGRMLPDGCLVHLGRKDFRVKVRGFRVEPAEIERALLDINTIKQAVVMGREYKSGDQRLVAYIVPAGETPSTVIPLRRCLAEKLPDYMIPSAFVFLDALPLMPNGKVDRQMLPAPGRVRPELETAFVTPNTPVEVALAEIWAEVLALDHVGIYDNFLDLGGNSLLATQVISRVIKSFQVGLSIQSLLAAPTVAEMAMVILQAKANEIGQEDLACILAELEGLSDEEAQNSLDREPDSKGGLSIKGNL